MAKKKIKKAPVKLLLPAPSLLGSGVKIGTLSLWLRFKHFATPTHLAIIGVGIYLVFSGAFTASFFLQRNVAFSFSSQTCFTSPTLLPSLIAKDQGTTFTANPQPTVSLAGYPIYSHTTCITPTSAPAAKTIENITFKPLGGPLQKTIRVKTDNLPQVSYEAALSKPIPTKDSLMLPIDMPDRIFDYQIRVNNKATGCNKTDRMLDCNLSKLGLEHSTKYTFKVERIFNGKVQHDAFSQTASTVGAVLVVGSSIAYGQVVFDSPTEIVLSLNKASTFIYGAELTLTSSDPHKKVTATTTLAGQAVTIKLSEPLERSASYELKIQNIVAPDGGHLPTPFVLPFSTSGGPKVKSANISSYKVSTGSNIVITFDSPISSQNLGAFVKLEINGNIVGASISSNGANVTINPTSDLPKCTHFTVRVLNGIKNDYGVAGESAWSYNSRTICQTAFGIGTSVRGRGITAYRFGNGDSKIVFVGTTHGDEKSSTHTVNSWVDYLERNYDQIPGHRQIIVIPNLNPDAYNASRRTNANDVDLNRNFPAYNWKQGVTMPGGSFNPNGGGNAPLSEPESSALASYILGINPRLVLTYHAAAGVVIPNDSGDSDALAKVYDQKSNLAYEANSQTGAIFTYDTTGSFEEWLHDKHGIPAILVELWTKSNNEFTKNQNAMMHMVMLP